VSHRHPLRPRATLTQLLVSIAILAFPMGLYGTELRGIPGRRPDMILLIECLVAHCVELEAFFWLILAPRIGALLARWRARQSVPCDDDGDSTEGCTFRVLLWFGSWFAVIVPLSGWAVGYRWASLDTRRQYLLTLVLYLCGLDSSRPHLLDRPNH
jgi:hypothetical protein